MTNSTGTGSLPQVKMANAYIQLTLMAQWLPYIPLALTLKNPVFCQLSIFVFHNYSQTPSFQFSTNWFL
jgi:hypothetical protein